MATFNCGTFGIYFAEVIASGPPTFYSFFVTGAHAFRTWWTQGRNWEGWIISYTWFVQLQWLLDWCIVSSNSWHLIGVSTSWSALNDFYNVCIIFFLFNIFFPVTAFRDRWCELILFLVWICQNMPYELSLSIMHCHYPSCIVDGDCFSEEEDKWLKKKERRRRRQVKKKKKTGY